MKRSNLLLVLTSVIVACGAPTATSVSESEVAESDLPSVTEEPSSTPTASTESVSAFEWPDGSDPVVTRDMTGIDENFINPGAVIDQNGVLHMYANVFSAWPGNVQVAHLTSTDGATWTLASDRPIMTSADVPYSTAGHDVSSGFVTADGTWVLVFSTVSSEPWEIGLATAPGPDGPWTVLPDPVLSGGGAAAGEEGGLAWPSVAPIEDGWAMYFTEVSRRGRGGTIGMATSADGLSWTRRDEPVLVAEADWELTSLDRPRVVPVADGYVMVYAGRTLTDRGMATSEDGIAWSRVGDAPAMTLADYPVPSGGAWDAALIHREGLRTTSRLGLRRRQPARRSTGQPRRFRRRPNRAKGYLRGDRSHVG